MKKEKVVVITKNGGIQKYIANLSDYDFGGAKASFDELDSLPMSDVNILLIVNAEPYPGSTITESIKIARRKYPYSRIVYLAGEILENNTASINELGELVREGIYDIYHKTGKMNGAAIVEALSTRKTPKDVQYLTKNLGQAKAEEETIPVPDFLQGGARNVATFSSIKPGSGKSFVSTNVAVAIAKYGRCKKNGEPPKVAIIEGDLQTLSVGTLLHMEDPKRNLGTAMQHIAQVMDSEGNWIASDREVAECKGKIRDCFIQYPGIPNLYGLVGSQLSFDMFNNINPSQYYFLVLSVLDQFDVIIVDTNSSLDHITTGPLLELARHCYYILDLDYNNIKNNIRYRSDLSMLGVDDKIHYVLNRDVADEGTDKDFGLSELKEAGIELEARIPKIDQVVMFNDIYNGAPIVLEKDEHTKGARDALLKIADGFWPLVLEEKTVKKKKKWYEFWKK